MANQKLTKRVVDAAKPTASMYEIRDTIQKGFGVRIFPSGTKKFFFAYKMPKRHGARQGFVSIGTYASPWTVELARDEASRLSHSVRRNGEDVALARKAQSEDAVSLAFDTYAELFIRRYLPVKWERFCNEGTRLLRREAIPHFRNTPLPSVTKRDVTALFDKLSDRPGIAKNTSTVLRKLFNWAEARGDIPMSPMLRIELPKGPGKRKRYLDDNELAALWAVTLEFDHPYAALVRTLILLGQRRDEVANMKWEELDLEARTWTIPGQRTKNKHDHLVPLPQEALAELFARPNRTGWVFSVSGDRPIQNWSYWKRKLNPRVSQLLIERGAAAPNDWTLHDLRRSVSTGMQRLGFNRDWVEVTQNRALTGETARRYQLHEYLPEKWKTLTEWDRHIAALGSAGDADANVVLSAAAG